MYNRHGTGRQKENPIIKGQAPVAERDELQEMEDDLLLEMAAKAYCLNLEEDVEAFVHSDEYIPPDEAQFEAFGKKLRKQYYAMERQAHRRLFFAGHPLRKVVAVAALFVMLCAFTVGADRMGFFDFFSQDYGTHSMVWGNRGVKFDKPEDWPDDVYPTWIPSGYTLDLMGHDLFPHTMIFSNGKNASSLTFSWAPVSQFALPNTENMTAEPVIVAGQEQTMYMDSDGKRKLLVIETATTAIVIDGVAPSEDIVSMAEQVYGL